MKTLNKAIDLKYSTHAFYKDLIELDLLIFTDTTIKTLKLNNEEYKIESVCFDGDSLNTNSIRLKKNNKPMYILHRRNITLFTKDKTFKIILRDQDVSNKDNNYKANNFFWKIPSYIICIAENNQNYLVVTEILEEKVDLSLAQKIDLILRAMEYCSFRGMYFINLSYDTVKFYKRNNDIRPLLTKTMLRKVDDIKNFIISEKNITSFDRYLYLLSNLFYMMALRHYEGKNNNATLSIFKEYFKGKNPIFYKNIDLQVVRLIISMRFGSKVKLTQFNQLRQMLLAEIKPEIKEKYRSFCTIDTGE